MFGNDLQYRSKQAIRIYSLVPQGSFSYKDVGACFGNFLVPQGSFSYKHVGACFGNFLVPQGSLISYNIISKCGKDSLMFQNPFLIRSPYSS